MSGTAKIAVIVLAAGQSRRFGASDKLISHYNGKPLAAHAASSLRGVPYTFGAVVARKKAVASLFHHTRLTPIFPKSAATQSESLRAGLQFAQHRGASHALLLLADMPHVTPAHLKKMIGKVGYHPAISSTGKTTLPPALIPRALFKPLMRLRGDRGAGSFLRRYAATIKQPLSNENAQDIDTRIVK